MCEGALKQSPDPNSYTPLHFTLSSLYKIKEYVKTIPWPQEFTPPFLIPPLAWNKQDLSFLVYFASLTQCLPWPKPGRRGWGVGKFRTEISESIYIAWRSGDMQFIKAYFIWSPHMHCVEDTLSWYHLLDLHVVSQCLLKIHDVFFLY